MIATNNGEGGSNGTAITTGNSGGASGTAWNAVSVATGTVAYDSSQSAHGGLSIRQATTTADSVQLQWTTAVGSVSRLYGRFYYRTSSLALALDLVRARSSLGNQVARLDIFTSGALRIRNAANTVAATSTATMSTNTWYRIEFDFRFGASVANTAWLYSLDSVVPLETLTVTDNFSAETDIGQFHLGNLSSTASVADRWFDDIAVTDVGWLGPASARNMSALGCG
jgi:hypothetical protein